MNQRIATGEDIVSSLLVKPFSSRGLAERKIIIQEGRPQPKLGIKTKDRVFQDEWYSKKDWLCGSEGKNRLFCWPCLLFRHSHSTSWTKTGYFDMHHFMSDCKKHERAKSHMEAYKLWRTFDTTERIDVVFSRARREEIQRHNEHVRQNRDMLKIISEAVLFLAKQELPFRGHDESSGSLNKGNYRELLHCFVKFDSVFERRLQGRLEDFERGDGVFTGVSPDTQNELISCVDSIIADQIIKELNNSTFVSIQIDETTDISTKEQLSAIIRLDKGGEIVERFLKFVNISSGRSADSISKIVGTILNGFGESLREKLIMQTYDGASVMAGHISGVQAKVREHFPYAFFFHCAAHRLNLVLCQSASRVSPVKVFFANVSAFSSFTSVSSKRKDIFSKYNIDIPKPGETRWYYRSRTVKTIYRKYNMLMKALEEIVDNPQGWDDSTLTQASGLLQHLSSFVFCFLIFIFNDILHQSSILYDFLQNRNIDFSSGVKKVSNFKTYLMNMRNTDIFDSYYQGTVDVVGQPTSRSDRRHNYKQLYYEVIDNICTTLDERFDGIKEFAFLDLVNPIFFHQWQKEFPTEKVQLLNSKYDGLFNVSSLKHELQFIYSDDDFCKDTPMELLQYLYSNNLHPCLPEVTKLLKLNGTMAISSASVERTFSCLNRVKTYLRSKMGQERLGSLCRISIHKDILNELEDQHQLHSLIVDKFAEKPRRLDFLYK